ncbi:MAG: hypothetical protein JW779_03315 [Candidatus Thorarchaeota archaeon]|nr:hypothetical protein [Candidatus Thorarchaeota archaeon]
MVVIASTLLYDLLGSKVLASLSFMKEELSEDFLLTVVEEYYTLVQEESTQPFILTKVHQHAVAIGKINDVTIIITISDSDVFSDDEITRIQSVQKIVTKEVDTSSVRDFKGDFIEDAEAELRTPLRICFVTQSESFADNMSAIAVDSLMSIKRPNGSVLTDSIAIGPFSVKAIQMSFKELIKIAWNELLSSVDVFALVVNSKMSAGDTIQEVVLRLRSESAARIIVVPGSDRDLDTTRDLEIRYGVDLCDSVSPKPMSLLLSVMAYGGFSDVHPELAREKWILEDLESELLEEKEEVEEDIGHQAFFVVDKRTGEAAYSYYYQERSRFLEMSPNIVAAITSFRIDTSKSAETSVFRTGDLSYITIERDEYVFTLITGKDADVESLRTRFSFLPELFTDEVPEVSEDPTDLFRSPLFTIKLLATLPPEDIPKRVAPRQKRALVWDRFEHASVGDFLEAVWTRLDGSITMARLAPGKGPELILGAIHLLKRLDAIDCQLRVSIDDVPTLIKETDEETLALYANLEEILKFVDGEVTIQSISNAMGVQPSVLVKVFAELHKRGFVSLKEK